MRQVMKQYGAQHAKKTRKRQRRLQKAIQKAKKQVRTAYIYAENKNSAQCSCFLFACLQSTIKEKQTAPNFPALQMINDPQAVAEKVGKLESSLLG